MAQISVAARQHKAWLAFLSARPRLVAGWPVESGVGDPVASALRMQALLDAGYVSEDGSCWCCVELPAVDAAVAEVRAQKRRAYRREVVRSLVVKAG